jgi:phenylpropionate dioxygenase-like ring-hydroxylating dioxygenase large terminal subunit
MDRTARLLQTEWLQEKIQQHPLTIDGRDPGGLRGDPITGERYYSKDFARREWEQMWTRIWHVAGRLNEIPQPGDYLVHDFMQESVICVRQDDGSIRAFYNTCGHRGLRLVHNNASVSQGLRCPYHGWLWGKDGVLKEVQDPQDFPQGNPCGKLSLRELRSDTWGGLIWYTMAERGPSLAQYLEPLPEIYANYPLETLVRVGWMKVDLNTNWKFATDNFSESYHTRTAHPQVAAWVDQDVDSARHEMYPNGHGRTVQPIRPSLTDRLPPGVQSPYDAMLREWEIDPDKYPNFEAKVVQGWRDLRSAKRRLWKERGFLHYERLTDEELTGSPHTVIFPNVTISIMPDHAIMFRTEPHAEDPNKCTFELWCMAYPVEGAKEVNSIMMGPRPLREAELVHRVFDDATGVPELTGSITFQDVSLAESQQRGLKSRGYRDAYLAAQETRMRFFHEVLNDYLEGRR